MNKIYKDLKKQANEILPDNTFKESLKSQILPQSMQENAKVEKRKNTKTVWIKSMSAVAAALVVIIILAVCIAVPLSSREGGVVSGGETVVLIDINPSFEIVAQDNDKVKSVTGLNSDARIVLLGKNYVGKDLYDVCNDIVLTAIRLNYVHTVSDMINIIAYNQNNQSESQVISKIEQLLTSSVDGKAQLSITNSDEAKQSLIESIILQFGEINGLNEKTITELHRILMNYDITKEEELDRLEDLWEEELEKAGYDDDIAEDLIEKWKEEHLKPLGEELDEEIEDYLEVYEAKLIFNGTDEDLAEKMAKEEYERIKAMGDRNTIRQFIDAWWKEAEEEYFTLKRAELEDKGLSEQEIDERIEKIKEAFDKEDSEDKKEEIADYLEEYYERD